MTQCDHRSSRRAADGDVPDDPACSLPHTHEIDLALCMDLEALADGLPQLCGGAALRKLTERLLAASARWSDPKFDQMVMPADFAVECRMIDSAHAEDVVDALWTYWRQREAVRADQLGYMLRALFDGRRRAIAIERLALGCSNCQSSEID